MPPWLRTALPVLVLAALTAAVVGVVLARDGAPSAEQGVAARPPGAPREVSLRTVGARHLVRVEPDVLGRPGAVYATPEPAAPVLHGDGSGSATLLDHRDRSRGFRLIVLVFERVPPGSAPEALAQRTAHGLPEGLAASPIRLTRMLGEPAAEFRFGRPRFAVREWHLVHGEWHVAVGYHAVGDTAADAWPTAVGMLRSWRWLPGGSGPTR